MGSGLLCDIRHDVRSPGQPPFGKLMLLNQSYDRCAKHLLEKVVFFTKTVVGLPQKPRLAVTCLL